MSQKELALWVIEMTIKYGVPAVQNLIKTWTSDEAVTIDMVKGMEESMAAKTRAMTCGPLSFNSGVHAGGVSSHPESSISVVDSRSSSRTTARAARAASSKPWTVATPSIETWRRRLLRIASTVFSSKACGPASSSTAPLTAAPRG